MTRISKNIPVPASRGSIVDLLRRMKVGDSTVVEADKVHNAPYYNAARRIGIKIALRTVKPGKQRVWRIA